MTPDPDPLIERLAAANPVRRPARTERRPETRRRGASRKPPRGTLILLVAVLGVSAIALGHGILGSSKPSKHVVAGETGTVEVGGASVGHWQNVSYEVADAGQHAEAHRQTQSASPAVDPTAQEPPNPANALYGTLLDGVSCGSATACIGVGYFEDTSHTTSPLSEHWNGSTWTLGEPVVPAGAKGRILLEAVSCGSAEVCMAVGSYINSSGNSEVLAEQWNGAKWVLEAAAVPSGAKGSWLFGVSCASATSCEAVGMFTNSAGSTAPLAEAWDGTTWSVQEPPAAEESPTRLTSVSCPGENECVAVGTSFKSPERQGVAEVWNGKEWAIQKTAVLSASELSESDENTQLVAVSCTSFEACTAVGWSGGSDSNKPLAERWNGKEWKTEPVSAPFTPASGGQGSRLDGVSCGSSGSCFAVGQFENQERKQAPLAAHWNGSSWSAEEPPVPASADRSVLYSISCSGAEACTGVGKLGNPPNPGKGLPQYTPLAERFE